MESSHCHSCVIYHTILKSPPRRALEEEKVLGGGLGFFGGFQLLLVGTFLVVMIKGFLQGCYISAIVLLS